MSFYTTVTGSRLDDNQIISGDIARLIVNQQEQMRFRGPEGVSQLISSETAYNLIKANDDIKLMLSPLSHDNIRLVLPAGNTINVTGWVDIDMPGYIFHCPYSGLQNSIFETEEEPELGTLERIEEHVEWEAEMSVCKYE